MFSCLFHSFFSGALVVRLRELRNGAQIVQPEILRMLRIMVACHVLPLFANVLVSPQLFPIKWSTDSCDIAVKLSTIAYLSSMQCVYFFSCFELKW